MKWKRTWKGNNEPLLKRKGCKDVNLIDISHNRRNGWILQLQWRTLYPIPVGNVLINWLKTSSTPKVTTVSLYKEITEKTVHKFVLSLNNIFFFLHVFASSVSNCGNNQAGTSPQWNVHVTTKYLFAGQVAATGSGLNSSGSWCCLLADFCEHSNEP